MIINKPALMTNQVERVYVTRGWDKLKGVNRLKNIGFLINRENLFDLLTKANIRCTYEPCIHACVNIKYNYKNKETISIFVFESGSIIITGAKTKNHIIEAYKFITKILFLGIHL